jgi:hypothetical protein
LRSRQCRKASAVHRLTRLLLRQAPERIGCHIDLVGPNDSGTVLAYAHLLEQFGRLRDARAPKRSFRRFEYNRIRASSGE